MTGFFFLNAIVFPGHCRSPTIVFVRWWIDIHLCGRNNFIRIRLVCWPFDRAIDQRSSTGEPTDVVDASEQNGGSSSRQDWPASRRHSSRRPNYLHLGCLHGYGWHRSGPPIQRRQYVVLTTPYIQKLAFSLFNLFVCWLIDEFRPHCDDHRDGLCWFPPFDDQPGCGSRSCR